MNSIAVLKHEVKQAVAACFPSETLVDIQCELTINLDQTKSFGDLTTTIALPLAKRLGQSPREVANRIKEVLLSPDNISCAAAIKAIEIAGPGFINITLHESAWALVAAELYSKKEAYFALPRAEHKKYLIEFVSVNPTGPMHHGHARGGIVGDVLARVLKFLGNRVDKEFYINDAGNQITLLGQSLQVRCLQLMGQPEEMPENGYAGEYLLDLAHECYAEFGERLLSKDLAFFCLYAREHMLQLIKADLDRYGIHFDRWFSEKTLHENGAVDEAILMLQSKGYAYEQDGALWFASTAFGDDKDRVLRKQNGEVTYIAPDIAYHQDKFNRGYDVMVNVFGQDHHGYVKRLKSTLKALGYNDDKLDVILIQLVSFKESDITLKMSKRSGKFISLSHVLDLVGTDVARFFYLNRKPEAHLDFDLQVAVKTTDENPVFYIQYAYVRAKSVLNKACEEKEFKNFVDELLSGKCHERALFEIVSAGLTAQEIMLIKKIVALGDVLRSVAGSYQTHLIAYYAWELAHTFHNYYAHHRIVDGRDEQTTKLRLCMIVLVQQALTMCLDLLGLSKPESM